MNAHHRHDHHDLTNGNPFDDKAATWDDDPTKIERARVVATAIRGAIAPGTTTRVLEYGAGTGLVSQFLAPHVGSLVLADTSRGMREAMEHKITTGVLPDGALVVDWDLAKGTAPEASFDVVVTVLTLHHLPDPATALRAFAELLPAGGHVCIADLDEEDGSFHGDAHEGHVHHGFDREDLQRQLEAAGFRDVQFSHVHSLERDSSTYPMFLAVARR